MNFKLEETYAEIDRRAEELRELDIAFPLLEVDHVWPKLGNRDQRCRCPKHRQATENLFWACYDRILEAKRGATLKPAKELGAILEGLKREK
jgi:hypothetical protein